jgi:hypothetical protein
VKPPARPLEQGYPGEVLELAHLHRDGGLREVQQLRRRGEGERARRRLEDLELPHRRVLHPRHQSSLARCARVRVLLIARREQIDRSAARLMRPGRTSDWRGRLVRAYRPRVGSRNARRRTNHDEPAALRTRRSSRTSSSTTTPTCAAPCRTSSRSSPRSPARTGGGTKLAALCDAGQELAEALEAHLRGGGAGPASRRCSPTGAATSPAASCRRSAASTAARSPARADPLARRRLRRPSLGRLQLPGPHGGARGAGGGREGADCTSRPSDPRISSRRGDPAEAGRGGGHPPSFIGTHRGSTSFIWGKGIKVCGLMRRAAGCSHHPWQSRPRGRSTSLRSNEKAPEAPRGIASL